ncbi:MAG: activase [Acidobacteriia bacterium]|nr:activase [Terriglobia bacterium]
MICAIDVGSTTCKYVLESPEGAVIAKGYERHHTRQAEKVLEFLVTLEARHALRSLRDRVFLTGSGCGVVAHLVGGRVVQEVVAVAAAVEKLYPDVRFVSEIGGEDMKTIFLSGGASAGSKQVFMQSACSGGTGTFIEKTARKLEVVPEKLATMRYSGVTLHKISSKCGIFAEADANTLLKSGATVEEIIASLFEAVVYQNLATLTRGNTPFPQVLLLGGPNLFFTGLQQAWQFHLQRLWQERKVALPRDKDSSSLIEVPAEALYFGALGCVVLAKKETGNTGVYRGTEKLRWWIEEGQLEEKKRLGRGGLWKTAEELQAFKTQYGSRKNGTTTTTRSGNTNGQSSSGAPLSTNFHKGPLVIGCDFGSTTAKAVCLSLEKEVVFSTYALSRGNPIEDAKTLFHEVRHVTADRKIVALGITGYGKDLLKDILGADGAVVETVAHAAAGLHFFPDADCICDVGGVDVKIMILRQGKVIDFRLNSQCSSGNGAFLQGVSERFGISLSDVAERAFQAEAVPELSMGCGVFLQSDIVNQQRKGWGADEILAALCAILPLNVWIYAGGLNNLQQVGRKYILQGGTHKNLAVIKAQVDFIRSRIPQAEVVVHPYSGEAGAIGAALVALDAARSGEKSRFRGFEAIENLSYRNTTSEETVCHWCPVNCRRTFIDVELPDGHGRPWSKVPLGRGWERVIVNNSCPKGLVEDVQELRIVKERMEKTRNAFPSIAQMVREEAFHRTTR